MALSRNSPVITNRVNRFAVARKVDRLTVARKVDRLTVARKVDRLTVARKVDRLTVARKEVRRKLHLSLESVIPRRGLPKPWALPDPTVWNG